MRHRSLKHRSVPLEQNDRTCEVDSKKTRDAFSGTATGSRNLVNSSRRNMKQNGQTYDVGTNKTGNVIVGTPAESQSLVKPASSELYRTTASIFLILAMIRMFGAFANPISDCDETFNYWEPMHYLLFGFGFQTWEYSPEYALRSYAFLYPYAVITKVVKILQVGFVSVLPERQHASPKVVMFYGVRVAQGLMSACSETALVMALWRRGERRVGKLLIAGLATSPGMFRASVELLPSSFSMICVMGSFAAWISCAYGTAVIYIAVASLLGWVFASVMGIPLALDLLFRRGGLIKLAQYALISGVLILLTMAQIDTWHFGKLVLAPFNHILYNVFPKPGTGSHLYGEEPSSFYAINLWLNMPAATIVFAIYPMLWIASRKVIGRVTARCRATYGAAAYLALAVFISQPHKEERFLAPIYPIVALVAAFGLDSVARVLQSYKHRPIWRIMEIFILWGYVIGGSIVGISRSGMQVWSYRAPLEVYSKLSNSLSTSNGSVDVCVGAEWYRFPGSMFLPRENIRLRFVDAGFDGLLPLPFRPKHEGGTRTASAGFNELNRAAKDQFFNGSCDIWVGVITGDEDYTDQLPKGISHPFIVSSAPFLDNHKSPRGLRAIYIPGLMRKLIWAKYVAVSNTSRYQVLRSLSTL